MSKLSDKIYDMLKSLFPHNVIVPEYYINYKGNKLFFDFFIRDLNILFECQGKQHSEFTKHFHLDREGFLKSKHRDNLKIEYTENNKIPFVIINYNDNMSRNKLLKKIIKTQSGVLNNV